ncbi:hypothetical protein GYA27_00940 [candidate division WWE3 bacterium]|uniref:Uncharacterized protein n=1 Tax=candidate division WWE3 bacterium TaxID=2053526 RepID=A0A7X9HGW7_UNCKA|nr:hypothetical protein [candidate division WWE3 bacterium]
MKKFIVTFAATGGVEIFANTEEEAIAEFNGLDGKFLLDEIEANGIEMTDIFEEVD